MAIHRLYINDFEEFNYSLIAIHTDLEDYKLAFLINQSLQIHLKKNDTDIAIKSKEGESSFTRFVFDDKKNDAFWNLFENKNEVIHEKENKIIDLFSETTTTSKKIFMLPEFKKVDYFLKMEHTDTILETEIVSKLNKIDRIQTVYIIELEKIKNANNLIF